MAETLPNPDPRKTIEAIMQNSGSSKSTDKLALLMAGLQNIPLEKLNKVKTINLTWDTMEGTLLPNWNMEFYE